MACILNIETSTDLCSVCVSENGTNVYDEVCRKGYNQARVLAPAVKNALEFVRHDGLHLDAVAVSFGPGSYTGLRIGVSEAKGLCYGKEIPLIAISTLQTLCVPVLLYTDLPDDALLCPMIDARRMEVYCAIYDRGLRTVRDTTAVVVSSDSFAEFLDSNPVYFFGNGSEKCKDFLCHKNAHFLTGIEPLAKNMFPLAEKKYAYQDFADIAYCEPDYLKKFVATQSRNILNDLIHGQS
ncbi:MAG: tRNA (adenosine(37)-N6)-threonylcarbamoyltransferase complex dimerization subunit type 1 TsaB [Alloprevotella sp.]|nr:tRNA (adenosine(37)-N6)-threonylcarbamoyltransferase complex dimerization subunit type 1 TsaB [Alloprevotella sp.]